MVGSCGLTVYLITWWQIVSISEKRSWIAILCIFLCSLALVFFFNPVAISYSFLAQGQYLSLLIFLCLLLKPSSLGYISLMCLFRFAFCDYYYPACSAFHLSYVSSFFKLRPCLGDHIGLNLHLPPRSPELRWQRGRCTNFGFSHFDLSSFVICIISSVCLSYLFNWNIFLLRSDYL